MTLVELLPLFAQTGVFGAIIWVIYHMHRDAVRTHDQRARDWREAWEKELHRGDELARQLTAITDAVRALGKP